MNPEEAKELTVKEILLMLNESILTHAEAIRYLADAVALEEPLNITIGRGLSKIADCIRAGK